MLKRRLIPKLQMKPSRFGSTAKMVLVTTKEFGEVIEIGDPVSQAKIYEAQAADELIFLDLDASTHNRSIVLDVVKKAAEQIFMPFCVGGGIRSLEDFRKLLSNGADKVSINTSAIETPDLINQAAETFGSQCVVVSIDYRKKDGKYIVFKKSAKVQTHLHPLEWAVEAANRGAGEILLTSIERDGSRCGLDIELTRQVVDSVTIPVITSGGCGLATHFVEGFLTGKAAAVAAGTYFCFKDENPMQTRAQIKNAGISIRLNN
ncbi:imidazole glycerol phosphate synthase subunit HisF [Nostoc sp. TCL26-01]|uniref:imidazole glycerol phosphate synthase subunit HisF n=1 Tax=Nostoc sp. TCL26-01 TaxID=2576904 RepID=UPI0015C0C6AB|nr:imidazole glycerol phosphate synthase cyclase subunit [Nostoc sp. TCL26-01]QLE59136.1 imidazole glycerol phosphate synthase subunit HisF [Nostoc sp. TCL26-01]